MTARTYTVRDERGRWMSEGTVRRDAEGTARDGVEKFGGCWLVCVGDEIVTLVERDGSKIDVRRIG